MIQIRRAEESEIKWINSCYDEIEFKHSSFDKEIIAIAEFNGQKAGLGRLISIDSNNLELGGMYVFESFRGKKVARKIVEFLLNFSQTQQNIYCIAFENLVSFYCGFGFVQCTHPEYAPHEILEKYSWCKGQYPKATALLALKSKPNVAIP